MTETVQTYPCPQCRKLTRWTTANTHRPFCSARCKLIDLGAWASEQHRIPGESIAPDDDGNLPPTLEH